MKECIILRGVQGSGKSTFATLLQSMNPNSVIHETDSYFVNENGEYDFDPTKLQENHNKNFNAFCDSIFKGIEMVIVSNVNAKKEHFQSYIDYAKFNGYKVTVLVVENHNETKSVHDVQDYVIERTKANFEHYL